MDRSNRHAKITVSALHGDCMKENKISISRVRGCRQLCGETFLGARGMSGKSRPLPPPPGVGGQPLLQPLLQQLSLLPHRTLSAGAQASSSSRSWLANSEGKGVCAMPT